MGAQPKNKITRAERGARRRGNTPKLNKDVRVSSTPMHKRGLVAQIKQALGLNKTESKA